MTEWPRFLSSLRQDTSAELQGLVLRLDALHVRLQQDGTTAGPPAEILDELVAAIQDVRDTERELLLRAGHYERALDAERSRYVGLFDRAPDGYVVTTALGMIVDANAAFADLFGRRREHLVGKPLAVLVVLAGRRDLRKAMLHAAETGFADVDFDVESPRGVLNIEARATAELSEMDDPQIRWILRDVTARKSAQRALARLNDELETRIADRTRALETTSSMLQTVLHELPQGVVIVGSDGKIELANRRAEELLGQSLEELQTSPGSGSAPATLVRALLDVPAGETRRLELEHGDGGWTVLEARLATVDEAAGDAKIVTFDDVTARERRERTERDFVANAAHELQTPIAAIASAVDVLQAGAKERPEDRDRFLLHVERASERLGKLTRALLVLARAQSRAERPRSEVIALAPLLESVAGSLGVRDVRVECRPDVAVIANRALLEQALSNLGQNAVKYTDGEVVLAAGRNNGRVTIDVVDRGPGIPAADRAHVFERFYRAEGDRQGFGLGLSIVHAAVEALGGELELDSGAQGTRVSIELPGARVRST